MKKSKKISFHPFLLILLLPFAYNPIFGANPSEIPKTAFFLMFLAVMTIFSLFRDCGQKIGELRFNKKILIFTSLFVFSALVSTFFSVSPQESLFGQYFDIKGLLPLLTWILFFVYALMYSQESEDKRGLLFGIELIGLVCAAYAVSQRLTTDYSSVFGAGQLFGGRVYSFFSNPNDFGEYLIFPFFAALINLVRNRKNKIMYLHIASLALISIALLLSVNRGSILAIVVGLVVYFFLKTKDRKARMIGGLAVLGVIIFGLIVFLTSERSLLSRFVLWAGSLRLFLESPLIGFGPSSFPTVIQHVLSPEIYNYEQMLALPNHPHNETLSLLVSQGLLGVAVAGTFLFYILSNGIKKALKENDNVLHYAIITLVATLVTAQFTYLQITHIAYVIVSIALVCVISLKQEVSSFYRHTVRLNWVRLPLGLAIIFLMSYCSVQIAVTDHLLGKAMGMSFSSQHKSAKEFDQFLSANQPYAYPYEAYFTLLENSIFSDSSIRAPAHEKLRRYAKITNQNYRFHAYAGMLSYADGNPVLASKEFALAEKAAPNSALVCATLMSAAQSAGDMQKAKTAAKKCYGLLPDYIKNAAAEELSPEQLNTNDIFLKSNPVYYQILKLVGDNSR